MEYIFMPKNNNYHQRFNCFTIGNKYEVFESSVDGWVQVICGSTKFLLHKEMDNLSDKFVSVYEHRMNIIEDLLKN